VRIAEEPRRLEAGLARRPSALREGLARHAVALISLFVALSGLGYNTWRNETTEQHRNTRQAAFVMLEELGRLQQLVDRRFYAGRRDDESRIAAWGKVALLRDMSPLVSESASLEAHALADIWRMKLEALDAGRPEAEEAISASIGAVRSQVLADLLALR
jgi:hypothetical protein